MIRQRLPENPKGREYSLLEVSPLRYASCSLARENHTEPYSTDYYPLAFHRVRPFSKHRPLDNYNKTVREAATICPAPCKLTFDLLTLKVVSESHVTWATSVHRPLCSGLRPDVRDKQTDARQTSDSIIS